MSETLSPIRNRGLELNHWDLHLSYCLSAILTEDKVNITFTVQLSSKVEQKTKHFTSCGSRA